MTAKRCFTALCWITFCLCFILPGASKAVSLQVENTTTLPGDIISVLITVDQSSEIAAALFAVTYNTEYFSLDSVAHIQHTPYPFSEYIFSYLLPNNLSRRK